MLCTSGGLDFVRLCGQHVHNVSVSPLVELLAGPKQRAVAERVVELDEQPAVVELECGQHVHNVSVSPLVELFAEPKQRAVAERVVELDEQPAVVVYVDVTTVPSVNSVAVEVPVDVRPSIAP